MPPLQWAASAKPFNSSAPAVYEVCILSHYLIFDVANVRSGVKSDLESMSAAQSGR